MKKIRLVHNYVVLYLLHASLKIIIYCYTAAVIIGINYEKAQNNSVVSISNIKFIILAQMIR